MNCRVTYVEKSFGSISLRKHPHALLDSIVKVLTKRSVCRIVKTGEFSKNSSLPLNVGCALYASSQVWQALFLSFFPLLLKSKILKTTLKNLCQTLVIDDLFFATFSF